MFSFSMDYERGILRCVTRGLWDLNTVNRYWDEVGTRVQHCESNYGRFTFLNDASEYDLQATDVQAVSEQRSDVMLNNPDNRVAIVVRSSLLKMQARRLIQSNQLELFLSPDAAMTWLTAWMDMSAVPSTSPRLSTQRYAP